MEITQGTVWEEQQDAGGSKAANISSQDGGGGMLREGENCAQPSWTPKRHMLGLIGKLYGRFENYLCQRAVLGRN